MGGIILTPDPFPDKFVSICSSIKDSLIYMYALVFKESLIDACI